MCPANSQLHRAEHGAALARPREDIASLRTARSGLWPVHRRVRHARSERGQGVAERPTNFNRSTSRTWRMVVLSAGIRSLPRKTKGADLSWPAETPDPGRDHPGLVGEIISERWARSSRNGGRHHSEIVGGIPHSDDRGWCLMPSRRPSLLTPAGHSASVGPSVRIPPGSPRGYET